MARGERFEFGKNWTTFLGVLDEERIANATASFRRMLSADLEGLRLLDAGSGSGLMSLVARRLGADVVSFDYDPASVACTRELRLAVCGDLQRPGRLVQALVADQEAIQLGRTGPRRHDGDRRPILVPAPARFRPDPSARSASLLAQSGISSL